MQTIDLTNCHPDNDLTPAQLTQLVEIYNESCEELKRLNGHEYFELWPSRPVKIKGKVYTSNKDFQFRVVKEDGVSELSMLGQHDKKYQIKEQDGQYHFAPVIRANLKNPEHKKVFWQFIASTDKKIITPGTHIGSIIDGNGQENILAIKFEYIITSYDRPEKEKRVFDVFKNSWGRDIANKNSASVIPGSYAVRKFVDEALKPKKRSLGKRHVIKILQTPQVNGPEKNDPELIKKIAEHEFAIMQYFPALKAKSLTDLGDGRWAIVMKHFAGGDVFNYFDKIRGTKNKNKAEKALRIMAQMFERVIEAHQLGIIHNDIKPENFFIDIDDTVVLADWAGSVNRKEQIDPPLSIMTDKYMAPELKRDQFNMGNESTDNYSLGKTFLALLEDIKSAIPEGLYNRLKQVFELMTHGLPYRRKTVDERYNDFKEFGFRGFPEWKKAVFPDECTESDKSANTHAKALSKFGINAAQVSSVPGGADSEFPLQHTHKITY